MTPNQKRRAMELRKYEAGTNTALMKALKKAIVNVRSAISGKLAELGNAATNSKAREQAIQAAVDALEKMQESMSSHLKSLTDVAARNAHDEATEQLKESGKKDLVQYDPARSERYMAYLAPRNAERLAAVFTDKMQDNLVRTLRFGYIDVARQAAVDGMTYAETNKALQERWQRDSGNESLYRFVDKSGRAWENARYFQMLVRTNSMRVWTDSYADSLASNGFQLARISDDGDPDCPICSAWEGRIVCVAGKKKGFPTYHDAQEAGVFHPNCTHRLQYMDETIDADEIDLQAKNPPSDMSPESMQDQKDKIDVQRELQSGKSLDEAKAAVASSRLERYIRAGLFSDPLATVASQLPRETLTKMFENGTIPRFALAKKDDQPWSKTRGGVLIVPRDATSDQLKDMITKTLDGKNDRVKNPSIKPDLAAKNNLKQVTSEDPVKGVLRNARSAIKASLEAAGFNPSFADILPEGVVSLTSDVSFINVKNGGAGYYDKSRVVLMNKDREWSSSVSSFTHEMGHAFAHKTGILKDGTAEHSIMSEAMRLDAESVLSELPNIFGENWKKLAANNKNFDINRLSVHLTGKRYIELEDLEDRKAVGSVADCISALTKGKYGSGHKPSYWKKFDKSIFADELTANCVTAISRGDQRFMEMFGNSVRAVEKIEKSVLDKTS